MFISNAENDDDDDDDDNDETMDTTEGNQSQPRNPDDEFNFAAYDDEGKSEIVSAKSRTRVNFAVSR